MSILGSVASAGVAAAAGKQMLGLIGGAHAGKVSEAKVGIKADTASIKALRTEFDQLRDSIKNVSKEFEDLIKNADKARGATSRAATTSGGKAQNGMPLPPDPMAYHNSRAWNSAHDKGVSGPAASSYDNLPVALKPGGGGPGGPPGGGPGGGGGGGGGMGGVAAAMIAVAVAQGVSKAIGAVNNRVDNNRSYALSADRLNVLLQQQTGWSQMGIMQNIRQPLSNYRVGNPNEIMKFASETGEWGAMGMGSSWEAMRAMSGWSKSSADVVSDQRALMQPDVANQLFRMTGISPYNIGGGMQDPMKFRQQLTSRLGLTSRSTVENAMGLGSIMRANMAQMGLGEQQQTDLLTYAQQNITFQQKGGQGMYNPGNRAHQRVMGIDQNFATAAEETEQTRIRREEQFMERQVDNYKALEENTQAMIELKGVIEDNLSGPIGALTSMRNSKGWAIGNALAGPLGGAVGGGLEWVGRKLVGGDAPSGSSTVGSGPQGGSGGTSAASDGAIAVPVGYGGGRATLNELKNRPDFAKLDSKMQDRLLRMFRENPNLGFGGGYRDPSQQERMFRERYRPTNKRTKTFWQGTYWEHVSGAAAAPPGRSFHQVGLAADLIGDLGWMNANAGRFGLKHFATVNNEPWHVQPVETPNGWSEWEKQGGQANWGPGSADEEAPAGTSQIVTGVESNEHGSGGSLGAIGFRGGALSTFSGMSISEMVDAMHASVLGFSGSSGSPLRRKSGKGSGSASGSQQPTVIGSGAAVPAGGALSGEQVASILHRAGFRGQDLINMVAITKRESSWNPAAYNGDLGTNDQSYGLAQINTLNHSGGQMGTYVKEILRSMGLSEDFNQLYDPQINAAVAYRFYQDNGNTLSAWGAYKGNSNTYNTNVAEAAQIVSSAGLGDPFDNAPGPSLQPQASSKSLTMSPTYHIQVSPTVQLHASGGVTTADVKRVAVEVGAILEQEVRNVMMRNN